MRAAVTTAAGRMEVRDLPEPVPGPGEALDLVRRWNERLRVLVTNRYSGVVAPGRVRDTGRGASIVGPFVDGGDMARAGRVGRLTNPAVAGW